MAVSELAGRPAEPSLLVDVDRLVGAYYDRRPDVAVPSERVAFGTSGHRGSSLTTSFNEAHILATSAAICRYRRREGIDGPLFLGRDTHALSEPAFRTAIEVLVADGVDVLVDSGDGYTPTPAVSHAILVHNRGRRHGLADGIVVTPSHNPPGGRRLQVQPADRRTGRFGDHRGDRARGQRDPRRRAGRTASRASAGSRSSAPAAAVGTYDFMGTYVADLGSVVDMDAIRASGLHLGVDPLGGASVAYWGVIGERYGLDLTVTNDRVDPQFAFMTVDWDGKIRMDPSSPYAMASLVGLRDQFDLAFANDTDADRHGIVTRSAGLLNPNHFLSAAVAYLFGGGRDWPDDVAVGKTLVSTSMLDRVVASLGRRLLEVPVGFKWFVDGLLDGSIGFGGEESAGASFLRRDRSVWTTDKDGLIACLLAAEMTARSGRDPGEAYAELTGRFGSPAYRRIDAPASPGAEGRPGAALARAGRARRSSPASRSRRP